MDFDALKRVWVDCDKRLAAGMHLNARQIRSIVAHDDAATANRIADGDIDYTAPVALAQKSRWAPWRLISGQAGGHVEANTGTQMIAAWGPFAGVLALWVVALLYVRMSPTRFKRLLERMARNLPD